MEPEHLISIGIAFIVAVSACASLILSSNNKHDRISNRIRTLCNAHRDDSSDCERKENIKKQIEHFFSRYQTIQKVQEMLYSAIREFIVAFYIYILMSFIVTADKYFVNSGWFEHIIIITEILLGVLVAILFSEGMSLIWKAAHLQVGESMQAHKTLNLEFKDISPKVESRQILESKTIVFQARKIFQSSEIKQIAQTPTPDE